MLQAEASGLISGLKVAIQAGYTKLIIEGDSKLLIDCINGKCSIPWRASTLIRNIKFLACSVQEVSFTHIFREANSVADVLADIGYGSDGERIWFQKLPSEASPALFHDQLGFGCSRGFRL